MNSMLIVFIISMFLPLAVLATALIFSLRSTNDREKLSPFECGFDPNHTARIPFSTRFFLLAIIFIVFDIEIVLLMPLPLITSPPSSWMMLSSLAFLTILLVGLLHEWNQGSLNWTD